jgi:hypothetical protein
MRWCQAQTEDQLPPIYTALALAKKGNHRNTTQVAVTNAMETLGYSQDFPITTKMASRVVDLEWAHQLTDDLSTGLHIFTLGWLTAAETEDVKSRGRCEVQRHVRPKRSRCFSHPRLQ